MKKRLDPNSHAILDYLLGISCLAIPVLADFSFKSSLAAYAVGVAQIGLSLFTKYPVRAVKAIPFRLHGLIELGSALNLIALPFAVRSLDERAKTFFVSTGVGLLAVYAFTDYSRRAVEDAEEELEKLKEEASHQVGQIMKGQGPSRYANV